MLLCCHFACLKFGMHTNLNCNREPHRMQLIFFIFELNLSIKKGKISIGRLYEQKYFFGKDDNVSGM